MSINEQMAPYQIKKILFDEYQLREVGEQAPQKFHTVLLSYDGEKILNVEEITRERHGGSSKFI